LVLRPFAKYNVRERDIIPKMSGRTGRGGHKVMQKTWKPTTAGILTIIGGAMGIGGGSAALFFRKMLAAGTLRQFMPHLGGRGMMLPMIPHGLIMAVGIIGIVFGIISIVGGIYALKRKMWGLALAGSILAIPTSQVLGVLAVIFVSLGKGEFTPGCCADKPVAQDTSQGA
jgi:hypothetical protein